MYVLSPSQEGTAKYMVQPRFRWYPPFEKREGWGSRFCVTQKGGNQPSRFNLCPEGGPARLVYGVDSPEALLDAVHKKSCMTLLRVDEDITDL
jgi:hypothetical protein